MPTWLKYDMVKCPIFMTRIPCTHFIVIDVIIWSYNSNWLTNFVNFTECRTIWLEIKVLFFSTFHFCHLKIKVDLKIQFNFASQIIMFDSSFFFFLSFCTNFKISCNIRFGIDHNLKLSNARNSNIYTASPSKRFQSKCLWTRWMKIEMKIRKMKARNSNSGRNLLIWWLW